MKKGLVILLALLVTTGLLSACSLAKPHVQNDAIAATNEPATSDQEDVIQDNPTNDKTDPDVIVVTQEPEIISGYSYPAAEYRDESANIILDYPSDWTVSPREQVGERGAQAALISPGSTVEQIAENGSRIFISTYVWDPKTDLAAYVAQRRLAWEASGFEILSNETSIMADGRLLEIFHVKVGDGSETVFAFTIAGDNYLQLFGDGDLSLCEEIIHSLRPAE